MKKHYFTSFPSKENKNLFFRILFRGFKNKKGAVWWLWGITALVAGIGWIASSISRVVSPSQPTIPIWVWLIIGLILLIIILKR